MSTAPARLELLPPTPPGPPHVPAPGVFRSQADRRATAARARRVMLRLGLGACCVIPTAVLLEPVIGEAGMVVSLLVVGALVFPCGIGLICTALVEWSRESVVSLLFAVLSLVAAVALVKPAEAAAIELHVAAHQAELDALAADIRATEARVRTSAGPPADLDQWTTGRFGPRLRALGLNRVEMVDGGLLFLNAEGPYILLYADGVAGPKRECADLRALGGRWFQWRCFASSTTYED